MFPSSLHTAPLFGLNPVINLSQNNDKCGGEVNTAHSSGIESVTASINHSNASTINHCAMHSEGPWSRTQQPIVTGTSVIGIVFKDGVMLSADTLGSYGSLARFRDERRLFSVGKNTCVGASGDLSDMQFIQHKMQQLLSEDFCVDDGHEYSPESIYEYLSRMMYTRRCKMNPLWNSLVVGGVKNGKKLLACVDIHGTTWQATTIATGFGAYLAQPLLRKAVEGRENTLSEQEAATIMDDCLRVLYYRDARSLNKYQRAVITDGGVKISEPYELKTEWISVDMARDRSNKTPFTLPVQILLQQYP